MKGGKKMLTELMEFWEENKFKLCLLGIVLLLGGGYFAWNRVTKPSEDSLMAVTSSSGVSSQLSATISQFSQNKTATRIYVDVKGAVKKPGVYQVPANVRVNYVLAKAGGLTADADLKQVNLASQLVDQMIVYIPQQGETPEINSPILIKNQAASAETEATSEVAGTEGQGETDASKINLNTATKEQLMELTGIGDKKAEQIIAYRQEHGKFNSIDDLKNVSGIGDKTFASISSRLTVWMLYYELRI